MEGGQSFYFILVVDLKPLRLTVARIITIWWIRNCLWNKPNILSRDVSRQVTIAIDSAGIISAVTKKPKMKKKQGGQADLWPQAEIAHDQQRKQNSDTVKKVLVPLHMLP